MIRIKPHVLIKSSGLARHLVVIPVAAFGIIVGVLVAHTFAPRSLSNDPVYDTESARDITSRNSTDDFVAGQQARINQNPSDGQAFSYLGIAFIQKARETSDPTYYTKADGVLHRALEINPNDVDAMSALGSLALARHQFHEGLDWGEKVRAMNPVNAHNYGVIGDAQIELGLYPDAILTFQTMVNMRPDLSSYSRVSYARELHGDLSGAVQAMRQAVDAGGPNAENTNWARVQLGNLQFEQGQYAEAEHEYQAALNAFPDYAYALAGLGSVAVARGDYATAISLYARVVNTMPLPSFVMALGDLYATVGQNDQAVQQYGLLQVEEKLYEANGVDVDAEMALYDADHNLHLPDALARARAAYARRPSITVADVLAWTLYKEGEYVEAQEMMNQALRLGTRNALMYYHAGMIAYSLGQRQVATDYLERAITLNPHFSLLYASPAQKLLSDLRQGK